MNQADTQAAKNHATATASAMSPASPPPLKQWRDRNGCDHQERPLPEHHHTRVAPDRIIGPIERAWEDVSVRESLRQQILDSAQPEIQADPDDPTRSLWTWTVCAPRARAVLLWTNPFFDPQDLSRNELAHLPESDLWTMTARMPHDLRASYRIAIWEEETEPPWRSASKPRLAALAAIRCARPDPRAEHWVIGSHGQISSVAAGPRAPRQQWNTSAQSQIRSTQQIRLDSGDTVWIYTPPEITQPTPLLVLFDGDVWKRSLPAIMDDLMATGVLPPLHVAMLDARAQDYRWNHLGVPAGQVDVVLDHLLPVVRDGWKVSSESNDTIVAGQSLGGISALWTLALGGDQVGHAIAQSPSLWRFDVTQALLDSPQWRSIELHAGTCEGQMLHDVEALVASVDGDPRGAHRSVHVSRFCAGHDWAAWHVNLVNSLQCLLARLQRD